MAKKKKRDGRGGARPGAGRKPTLLAGKRRASHGARPKVTSMDTAVHITMRLATGIRAKGKDFSEALTAAADKVADRKDFQVARSAAKPDHIHLIVRAKNTRALSSGMRAFGISIAKHVNHVLERDGQVFIDRYAAAVLAPADMRKLGDDLCACTKRD